MIFINDNSTRFPGTLHCCSRTQPSHVGGSAEQNEKEKAKRCSDIVIEWWLSAMKEVVLGITCERLTPWKTPLYPGRESERWSFKAQIEKMYFKEVTDMLQVVCIVIHPSPYIQCRQLDSAVRFVGMW